LIPNAIEALRPLTHRPRRLRSGFQPGYREMSVTVSVEDEGVGPGEQKYGPDFFDVILLPTSRTVWDWACRSAAPSSRRMAGELNAFGTAFHGMTMISRLPPNGHWAVTLESRSVVFSWTMTFPSATHLHVDRSVGPGGYGTFTSAAEFSMPRFRMCRRVWYLTSAFRASAAWNLQRMSSAVPACIIPIIFISGHGDVPMTVRAMKAGAVEFLLKPSSEQDLLDAITQPSTKIAARPGNGPNWHGPHALLQPTPGKVRWRQELHSDSQQAGCGGSRRHGNHVKLHRRHIMEKMQASSLAELVRMVEKLT